jgi:hypothetical protein
MHFEAEVKSLRDALRGRDRARGIGEAFGGRDRAGMGMHLEAEIE